MATEEQIKELAYAIWEQEGRLEGKDMEYYFRAKEMLEERETASLLAKTPSPSSSTPQLPAKQKLVKRFSGKLRSKKE